MRFARGLSGNFLAARIASDDKDTLAAVQFFERALGNDPTNPVLIQQTFFLHLMNGDVDSALPYAAEILQFDSSNDLARTVLGISALKQGNYGEAVDEFEEASGKTPLELLTNQLLAAWAEAGKDDLTGALARIDRLEGPDWYESFRSFHGGLIADHLGDREQAFQRVARAYEYDQSALRIVEGFARLQALKNAPEKGQAAIRAFGLGSALGRDGGTELPKIYLQLSLYLNPRSDLAIMALVDIYNQDEKYAEAVELVDALPQESVFSYAAKVEAARNLQLPILDDFNGERFGV